MKHMQLMKSAPLRITLAASFAVAVLLAMSGCFYGHDDHHDDRYHGDDHHDDHGDVHADVHVDNH
jgi:hypothetical protein